MTRLRGSWTAIAAVTLFLLSACARVDDTTGPGDESSAGPGASAGPTTPGPDALVLRIERLGGFMAPDQQLGRLPVVSVYGDGRVITQGPQIAIYPGPALPNILVQQVDPATLSGLLDKAAAAGVRGGADLGRPSVADAPTTRITIAAAGGTRTVDAVALTEAQPDDPRLTTAQRDARAKLAAFVQEASDLSAAKGMPDAQPYQPTAIAAFARPYTRPEDGLPQQPAAVAWPGPALPGTTFSGQAGCVTASGADAAKVLTAAKSAKSITPWTSGGRQWTVVFRPLLPDEAGCADLKAAR
jgi:hypothetical protein